MPPVQYVVISFIAGFLLAASAVLLAVGIMEMVDVGNCASGDQTFVISRPCPDGTTGLILWMVVASLGLTAAFVLYFVRGPRFHIPEREPDDAAKMEMQRMGFHYTPVRFHRSEVDDPGPWPGLVIVLVGVAVGVIVGLPLADAVIPDLV